MNAEHCLARDRGPDGVACGERRHVVVGTVGPDHAFSLERPERVQPLRTEWAEISGVRVAYPPMELGRRFGISRIEVALHARHLVNCAIGRDVRVNDAVAQSLGRTFA